MASYSAMLLLAVAVAALVLPYATDATEFVVGDDKGWSNKVNYTEWAAGKKFFVGDTLVFNYPQGKHNVFKASGPNFAACEVPKEVAPLTTGSDTIKLAAPGKKWYLCGVKGHCDLGQKLVINVLPAWLLVPMPAPASPPPSSDGAMVSAYPAVVLAMSMAVAMRAFY